MTKFTTIGAGMAGLLAAAMLRDECARVIEAQPTLPNNHSALLRFKTSLVGDTLNIPFSKVNVMKATVPHYSNPVGDALAYSVKTNGTATLRSSVTGKGEIEERYIAPSDLIAQMARKVTCPIHFGVKFGNAEYIGQAMDDDHPIISTLPMPVLMKLLEYDDQPEFRYAPGYTLSVQLENVDACATLYFPGPDHKFYRASITRDRLIMEYAVTQAERAGSRDAMKWLSDSMGQQLEEIMNVLWYFGLSKDHIKLPLIENKPEVKPVQYAKVLPIDDRVRKRFIMWASEQHNIFSLGRFATWRPGLLLDDLIQDIRVIQKIARDGNYEHKK